MGINTIWILIWIIIVGAVIFGYIYYKKYYAGHTTTDKAFDRGEAIKRKDSFFKQSHIFSTSIVGSIADIANAIDRNIYNEHKIKVESHQNNGYLLIYSDDTGCTFDASLRAHGKDGGKYVYCFKVDSFTAYDRIESLYDIDKVNVVLTQIEKAFLRLDRDTDVERVHGEFKSSRR